MFRRKIIPRSGCASVRLSLWAKLRAAALSIAVLGPEGASTKAMLAADVVCPSILVALELLIEPRCLVTTLRA